jgi:hypothetical protein
MVGKSATKPTVSERMTGVPAGSSTRRSVGSRVANRRGSAKTCARVSRLNSVDLPALQAPACRHRGELLLDADDPLLDDAPVGLDLCLAGTAQETEAAALPLEVGPAADEPAPLIFEMGELDLQLAFTGMRPLAKDLEDQPGPVDDLRLPGTLEIALLDRRERMVDDDQRDLLGLDPRRNLVDLAAAEEGARPIGGQRHADRVGHVEFDRLGEPDRLVEPGFRCAAGLAGRSGHRDEHQRPFAGAIAGARLDVAAAVEIVRNTLTPLPCRLLPPPARRAVAARRA